jgi:hypothetical protein
MQYKKLQQSLEGRRIAGGLIIKIFLVHPENGKTYSEDYLL